MNKSLLYLLLFLMMGCASEKKKAPTVYFAGEIVNPTSEYVFLFKGDVVLDSVKLDANNRFSIILDSVQEGLHHFYHKPELQYVYLEQGDSLQIRLNTVEFDESLVFSGSSEKINNFLLEIFLRDEQEEELVYSWYSLEPDEFSNNIDSLQNEKLHLLEELAEESAFSETAKDLARASIVYNSYIPKEAYPFYHKKKKGEKTLHKLPDDFYDYRKQIEYNNEHLTYLRPYYNFMKYHLGNLSYMKCKKHCDSSTMTVKNHLHFNKHQLGLIDSLISSKKLRDNLFRNVAVDYLLKQHDTKENNDLFIKEFHKVSGNNQHIHEIINLYERICDIQPDKEVPNLLVKDYQGQEVYLKEVTKGKKVAFYFWSAVDLNHFRNITKRVVKLQKKHPNYKFVGICLNTDELRWKSLVDAHGLDQSKQFWASDSREVSHALVVYSYDASKSVIAKDGLIIDAFANVYSSFKP